MKSYSRRLMIFLVIIVLFLLIISVLPTNGQIFFWQAEDVKKSYELLDSLSKIKLERMTTLFEKPPFYMGKMPLQFKENCFNLSLGMGSEQVVFIRHFGNWFNYFIYLDMTSVMAHLPAGAVTADNSNHVIAECKVKRMIWQEKKLIGFEIEEMHFGLKGVTFKSIFEVNYSKGYKTKEVESSGIKKDEYYFLWVAPF